MQGAIHKLRHTPKAKDISRAPSVTFLLVADLLYIAAGRLLLTAGLGPLLAAGLLVAADRHFFAVGWVIAVRCAKMAVIDMSDRSKLPNDMDDFQSSAP